MQFAVVNLRAEYIIVHSQSKTERGIWIGSPPYLRLSTVTSADELGIAIHHALESSLSGVPYPVDEDAPFEPLQKLAQVNSWECYVMGTRCCDISKTESGISLMPYRNDGPRRGFTPLPRKSVNLPLAATNAELGESVLLMLRDVCT